MQSLFAQAGGNGPPPGVPEAFVGLILGFYCLLFVFGIAGFVLMIMLFLRMSKVLEQVRPRNRQMEPGLVWLNLVPFLNVVWLILTVIRISDSLDSEYRDRDLRGDGDYGKQMGIIFYVTTLICPFVNLIFLFLYYKKLGTYLDQLTSSRGKSRDRDEDDRDDRE